MKERETLVLKVTSIILDFKKYPFLCKISGGSGSGDGSGIGRGAQQGGAARGTARPQSYILTTRPATAKIKVGTKGASFNAYTNAFKVFTFLSNIRRIMYLLSTSSGTTIHFLF